MMSWRGASVDTPAEAIHEYITVNTVAPLLLFRACLPLLEASSPAALQGRQSRPAKSIAITSAIGSTTLLDKLTHAKVLPYGLSKAALNHTMRKLSTEHPDIVIEVLTPGPVKTDLSRSFGDAFLKEAVKVNPRFADSFVPIDKVANGLMQCIDGACLGENGTSGGFRDWSGKVVPW